MAIVPRGGPDNRKEGGSQSYAKVASHQFFDLPFAKQRFLSALPRKFGRGTKYWQATRQRVLVSIFYIFTKVFTAIPTTLK